MTDDVVQLESIEGSFPDGVMTINIICSKAIFKRMSMLYMFEIKELESDEDPILKQLKLRDEFDEVPGLKDQWQAFQETIWDITTQSHEWALSTGMIPEVASHILVESMVPCKIQMTGTLEEFIKYCNAIIQPKTLIEDRIIARGVSRIICTECSNIAHDLGWVDTNHIYRYDSKINSYEKGEKIQMVRDSKCVGKVNPENIPLGNRIWIKGGNWVWPEAFYE